MTLFRALAIPFQFTSVVFITLLSITLAVAVRYDITGILWLIPAFMMTSWLFKYAFAMLETIADGELHAPVVSVEMLSPFEQRPLVLLPVVHELQVVGHRDLGLQLLMNFVTTSPSQTTAIIALRQRLEHAAR